MNRSVSKSNAPLSVLVAEALDRYFDDLQGQAPANLHELVIGQVERPLLEAVLRETRGNVSRAAQMLGISRGTLRTRMNKYGISGKSDK